MNGAKKKKKKKRGGPTNLALIVGACIAWGKKRKKMKEKNEIVSELY